nr:W protein [avian paramyxovirus 1]
MATFTDAEIDELFETSGTVIDSIITAQGKPVETVGRSAIPQGKTKALSLAWEKHGNTNTPAAQEPAGEQDQHGQNQASNSNRATSEEGLHSSQAQAATQPQEDANESQLKTGASSSLLSMLDKLSNKSSNAKKGAHLRLLHSRPSTPKGALQWNKPNMGPVRGGLSGERGTRPPQALDPRAPA